MAFVLISLCYTKWKLKTLSESGENAFYSTRQQNGVNNKLLLQHSRVYVDFSIKIAFFLLKVIILRVKICFNWWKIGNSVIRNINDNI